MLFLFFFVVVSVYGIILLRRFLARLFVLRLFRDGNVLVSGLRGRGKDMLFCWVVNRRRKSYISNVLYSSESAKYKRIKFEPLKQFSCGGNTCNSLINGTVLPYEYPYEDGIDYYISDAGVYFPSQECSSLNKQYKSLPLFQALSRQLAGCNVHCNVQNVNRLYDKLREQYDAYLLCRDCRVLFHKFVRIKLYYYDKLSSCQDRIKPMKRRLGKTSRIEYDKYCGNHGIIKSLTLHFKLPYAYDDRVFKSILRGDSNESVESV